MRAEALRWGIGLAAALAVPAAVTAQQPDRVQRVCTQKAVRCVDDSPGPGAEYTSIQRAVDEAKPGDTVLVFDGEYAGFRVRHGGTAEAPLRIAAAADGARIVSPEALSEDGIYVKDASYVVLEGFVLEGLRIPRYGIAFHDALPTRPMRGVVVRNNIVRGAGSTDIYLSQIADSVIEGNIASGSRNSHGIYLANAGSDNTVLRGNLCYDNAVNGIHFNGDQAETGDGLQWGLVVEGNIIHHNRANGLNMDGVQYSQVRNNLVFANGRHGLRAYSIDAADGPRMLTIANNTFADNGGWAIKLTEDGGHHTIFNNILLSRSGSLTVDHPLVVSDYNLVQREFSFDGERTVVTFAAWQAAGHDRHSRQAAEDDLFAAASEGRFDLLPRAAAVDLGVFILNGQLAPDTDLAGRARPQGESYDAGAFEAVPGKTPR